ncbi:carboxyl-terminal-processing peptidase 2 chloroplastic [Phtheirospermum japonicum]|uniref:C-terminal processing peptidase n=1 Tax=Phtheirospermum japonicum TaxID=374723 RepID=A0A830BA49_9LAMI|nr:carboxyl-terminal-processing peptidase 2 chloroplastic [Phtheirospermum japonicum]
MEVILGSSAAFPCASPFVFTNSRRNFTLFSPQVFLKKIGYRVCCSVSSKEQNTPNCFPAQSPDKSDRYNLFLQSLEWLDKRLILHCGFFIPNTECNPGLRKIVLSLQKSLQRSQRFSNTFPAYSLRNFVLGVMLVMTLGAAVTKTPSLALSEENLLFLEAWRTLDRAYIDKNFNGQSWFRYRESALRNEPMNTREETYAAIRKMVATLDDPFTRFLEPQKFKSLRSGTRNTLTGVGVSIGYPTGKDKSTSISGLVVVSAAPGGPANRAGVLSGDLILAIDDMSTENMGIYDAAERLQREKVSLNPVKSRICRASGSGEEGSLVGYIKLTSFNQNASGAVREAIETLRGNNVNAFILDLRDNSGGLFPEGVEIAKICKIQSVFELSDGSGLAVTVARYETPAHTDIDKVGIIPDHPLPVSFPKDEESFCGCLQDRTSACYLNRVELFSR